MMFDLTRFTLRDMTECGAAIRRASAGASSMEEVANQIVSYLYEHLVDSTTGAPSSVLVRFFKTHSLGCLPESLRDVARGANDLAETPEHLKCLTLLATAGERPEWNNRTQSQGHQAIPLPDAEAVERAPMIARLMEALGVDVDEVLRPNSEVLSHLIEKRYSVFHVEEARNSADIPAQEEFVIPMGVRSVLGFGGVTVSGDMFSIIIFSRVAIAPEVAAMFKTIALSVRLSILPFDYSCVFESALQPKLAGGVG